MPEPDAQPQKEDSTVKGDSAIARWTARAGWMVFGALLATLSGVGKELAFKELTTIDPEVAAERSFRESQELKRLEAEAAETRAEPRGIQYAGYGATASCKTRYIPLLGVKFAKKNITALTLMVVNQDERDRSNVMVTLVGVGEVLRADSSAGMVITTVNDVTVLSVTELAHDGILEFVIKRIPRNGVFSLHLVMVGESTPQVALEVSAEDGIVKKADISSGTLKALAGLAELELTRLSDCSVPYRFSL